MYSMNKYEDHNYWLEVLLEYPPLNLKLQRIFDPSIKMLIAEWLGQQWQGEVGFYSLREDLKLKELPTTDKEIVGIYMGYLYKQ